MEYIKPKNTREAINLMQRWMGRARLIAGGTNIIPDMRVKAIKPHLLIDINHLKSLSYIKEDKKNLQIGGLTTISEMTSSKIIQKYAPILSEAAQQLGNPLVRNRATIAGNLADASSATDTAVPLLAFEAIVITDKRQIPIDQFFVGPNRTVLKKDEMVKEIIFPKPNPKTKMSYAKLWLRNAMAISVVSIAILMETEGGDARRRGLVLERLLRSLSGLMELKGY